MAMSATTRALVVLAYFLGFWVGLPIVLVAVGRGIDARLGWATPPSPLGLVPLVAGLGLMGASMRALWREGRGLPVSALPPAALVTSGVYAICRHPIYVGFNLLVLGGGLLLGSRGLTVVVAPVFLPVWWVYASVEERGLRRRFGGAYESYCDDVGMLPWLSRARWRRWTGGDGSRGGTGA